MFKSWYKKADEIHEYYIKLEETLQEVIQEESTELKLQLEQKHQQLENITQDKVKQKILNPYRHPNIFYQ